MSAHVREHSGGMDVTAYGGTRRERGGQLAAAVRGKGMRLLSISYSETYGFQSATYATYVRREEGDEA